MKKIYLLTFLLLLFGNFLIAQWDGNPATVNNPISIAPTSVYRHITVTDGADGIIVVWYTYNDATSRYEINAQRKTSAGAVAWGDTANPLLVVSFPGPQNNGLDLWDVKPDGYGGIYVSYGIPTGNDGSAIYLARISNTGNLLFGLQVTYPDNRYKTGAKLCVDAAGVIITWDNVARVSSLSPSSASAVFAQRYDTAGVSQWNTGGITVSQATGQKAASSILTDGNNGAFILFADTRNTINYNPVELNGFDLYAQHISNTGSRLWGDTDVAISTGGHIGIFSLESTLVTDNAGGFIVLYDDWKNTHNSYSLVTVQRVDGSGTKLWAQDGVFVYISPEIYEPGGSGAVVSDGINGIVTTFETRNSITGLWQIHLQRIDGSGNLLWSPEGKVVSEAEGDVESSFIKTDTEGNYVVCWSQSDSNGFGTRVMAQKYKNSGDALWPEGGVNVCLNPAAIPDNVSLEKSNNASMIAVWDDFRNETTNQKDIYCAKIGSNGILVNTASAIYYSAANGNWNNPTTWAGNVVPPAGAVVVVTNAVTVNTNITCTILTVKAPGSLMVLTGFTVIVLQ